MKSSEWPLVIFTLAMQLSVGIMLIYDLFILFPLYRSRVALPMKYHWILLIALLAAIIGVIFSFLHLGNPANAPRSLSNIGTSWLSREISGVLIYSSLLLVTTILHFVMPSAGRSLKWLIDITAVAGIILIFIMSRIYMIPARPTWNTFFTPLGFYMAAIVMGASLLLLFQINQGSWASQKSLAVLTISIPVIQLALLPVYMSWLSQSGIASGQGLTILLQNHMIAFYLRLILYLLAIAFGFWAFFSIRSDTTQNRLLFTPALLAWAAILAAQIIDRLLFYAQNISPDGF